MKEKKSWIDFISENTFIHILLSIILGFLVGAIFLAVMGLSVGAAYGRLINSVTSLKGFTYVVVYAVPYIVAGLSVAFSFKTGVFNIGAEGQFVVGAMAAVVTSLFASSLPSIILIPLCFLAAMCMGALWGVVVGILKTKRGINEVLSMIMFNWIAFYLSNYIAGLPGIKNEGSAEATKNIAANASLQFSKDFIKQAGVAPTFNWGFIIAILVTLLVWLMIEKTTLGYELKAVGANKYAAEYGGINVNRSILTALGISGAMAGLAGALLVMGMGQRISIFSSQEGYGFAGIVVALIGCSNPFGVFIAGLFYGALMYGGSKLNLVGAPTQLISVIVGTVVFFISISVIFRNIKYLKKRGNASTKKGVAKA
ncbi:MAG: ABC transporter permease [Clostridia bacterium]|nr:ABC transporter permease [Clostridia bacterium]